MDGYNGEGRERKITSGRKEEARIEKHVKEVEGDSLTKHEIVVVDEVTIARLVLLVVEKELEDHSSGVCVILVSYLSMCAELILLCF